MPPPIPLLFGPMLIGAFFNAILYGVLIVQSLVYFQTYKRDSIWLKLFVIYLIAAETLNAGFSIGLMYEPLILKYGQPSATTFFPILLPAEPVMTVVISTPIQLFIAWRISIINERWWIPAAIGFFAIVSSGGGFWLAYTVTHVRRFARKPDLHWPALTWLLASAIADVIITASLVYSLAKRKTGFVQTDDTINKIIIMTVQTGLITAIFAVLDVICFLVLPNTTLNFVWDLALSKLYTNALMSTLNARETFGRMFSQGQASRNQVSTNVLFSNMSFGPGTVSTARSIGNEGYVRSGSGSGGSGSNGKPPALHQVTFDTRKSEFPDTTPRRSFLPSSSSRRPRHCEDIEIGVVSVKEVLEI